MGGVTRWLGFASLFAISGTEGTERFEERIRAQMELLEHDPSNPAEARMLCAMLLADGRLDEASKRSGQLPKEDPFRNTSDYHCAASRGNLPALRAVVQERMGPLEPAKQFTVRKLELCRKITGFRRYVPYGEPRFQAGNHILLYVELDGFELKPWGDGFLLHLRYDYELLDDRGRKLTLPSWERVPPEEREDRFELRGPIGEFHQSFLLPLPKNLPGGSYTVRLTIKDEVGNRSANATVPVEVVFE